MFIIRTKHLPLCEGSGAGLWAGWDGWCVQDDWTQRTVSARMTNFTQWMLERVSARSTDSVWVCVIVEFLTRWESSDTAVYRRRVPSLIPQFSLSLSLSFPSSGSANESSLLICEGGKRRKKRKRPYLGRETTDPMCRVHCPCFNWVNQFIATLCQ